MFPVRPAYRAILPVPWRDPDPHEFAGHSLRAGFLTSAAEAGADVLRMMEVSRP